MSYIFISLYIYIEIVEIVNEISTIVIISIAIVTIVTIQIYLYIYIYQIYNKPINIVLEVIIPKVLSHRLHDYVNLLVYMVSMVVLQNKPL